MITELLRLKIGDRLTDTHIPKVKHVREHTDRHTDPETRVICFFLFAPWQIKFYPSILLPPFFFLLAVSYITIYIRTAYSHSDWSGWASLAGWEQAVSPLVADFRFSVAIMSLASLQSSPRENRGFPPCIETKQKTKRKYSATPNVEYIFCIGCSR